MEGSSEKAWDQQTPSNMRAIAAFTQLTHPLSNINAFNPQWRQLLHINQAKFYIRVIRVPRLASLTNAHTMGVTCKTKVFGAKQVKQDLDLNLPMPSAVVLQIAIL